MAGHRGIRGGTSPGCRIGQAPGGSRLSCLVLWITLLPGLLALDNVIDECRKKNPDPLGLQSGQVPDSAITASSSYDPDSVGPENARIRTETNGGAWCPQQKVSKDVYEYLQIDLGELKVVTLVETQGRFGNGQGQEFADQYLLEYQREPGGEWFRFRNRRGQEIFQGNTNTYIAELRELDPPIIARWMRFIPYSARPKTVCMRVEAYGCSWKDGTVQYNMPQGERRGTEIDLYDFTYDGQIKDSFLSGGLGQLTDGELGQSNFRLDPQGLGIKGYQWVGFRNETYSPNPVELVFKFDAVRNFSSVRIYTNNMFTKDVRVFKKASLWFSIGGKYYREEPIQFKYMRDTLIEFSRQVIISLQSHIGQYVKVQLHFDSKWMMISEVQFESEYAAGNFTVESPPALTSLPSGGVSSLPNIVEIDVIPGSKTENISKGSVESTGKTGGETVKSPSKDNDDLGTTETKESIGDEYIGIIIGTLATLILILFAIIVFIILRQRRRKYNNNHRAMKSIEPRHVTLNLSHLQQATLNKPNGKVSNGNMYNFVSQYDADSDREDTYTSREYAVPDMTKVANHAPGALPYRAQTGALSTVNGTLRPTPPGYNSSVYGGSSPTPLLNNINSPYASSDVINLPNIQGVSGSNVYACTSNTDLLWKDLNVIEFPRESFTYLEKLGEGQFGEVHLCEAVGISELLGDDFLVNRTAGQGSMLAAVKMLRHNADDKARADFQKEVKIMSQLKDPNIVRVLGVCSQGDPLCVLVEYMKFGDLNQCLQTLTLEGGTVNRKRSLKRAKFISHGCLIYMATQIASGMKYLESLNMVHRDLATRNCLVGHYYSIKISDFGMSRSLYSSDYYRIEGRAVLPIRWMAWESILLGKFSTKTDVWSFGVTLWEILTFGKQQPYETMTDEMVIDNCGHYYQNDGVEAYLSQPPNCPRELYDLMRECWNRDEVHRPTFHDVHMFLQGKNLGFNPRDEQQSVSKDSESVV